MTESTIEHGVPSFWFDRSGAFPGIGVLPQNADVVVIGGGIMGVASTYWLSRLGLRVVTIEAKELAWGASGRNGGFMICGAGLQRVERIRGVLEEEQIECEFETTGHLALASSSSVLDLMTQELAARKPEAEPLHVLDRGSCEEVLGLRISPQFLGGRWYPSGAAIHPVRFLYGLAAAAERRGAVFATRTPAQSVERSRRGDTLRVHTSRGVIQCRDVVLAANVKCGELLPELGQALSPARGQMLSTEPIRRVFRVGLAVDWGTVYWRQTADGVVVIGGQRGLDRNAETTALEGVNATIQSALESFLPSAFPEVPPISVTHRWSGIMDETPDGRPIVGQCPDGSNTWVVAGFGGHGLPPALGVAEALAKAIADGVPSTQLEHLSPRRFKNTSVTMSKQD